MVPKWTGWTGLCAILFPILILIIAEIKKTKKPFLQSVPSPYICLLQENNVFCGFFQHTPSFLAEISTTTSKIQRTRLLWIGFSLSMKLGRNGYMATSLEFCFPSTGIPRKNFSPSPFFVHARSEWLWKWLLSKLIWSCFQGSLSRRSQLASTCARPDLSKKNAF